MLVIDVGQGTTSPSTSSDGHAQTNDDRAGIIVAKRARIRPLPRHTTVRLSNYAGMLRKSVVPAHDVRQQRLPCPCVAAFIGMIFPVSPRTPNGSGPVELAKDNVPHSFGRYSTWQADSSMGKNSPRWCCTDHISE